jgi:hypothetical protein
MSSEVQAQVDSLLPEIVTGVLASPDSLKLMTSILDEEVSRKVVHILDQPISQSSVSKRIGKEIDLHVPYIVKKVLSIFIILFLFIWCLRILLNLCEKRKGF